MTRVHSVLLFNAIIQMITKLNKFQMHYISQNPGGGAANLTVASSVFGYIGTAPPWRRQSRLVWRQGPCHLVEDAFNPQVVQWIYRIGPHYVGSLQSPQLPGKVIS